VAKSCISIQIVTGIKVVIENFIPKVRKNLPRDRRSRATFCELRG